MSSSSEIASGAPHCVHLAYGCNLTSVLDCRPAVEEANKGAPTFARIFKEMILVTAEDKPLPRVAKGTVAKKAAVKLYDGEIDAL